MLSARGAIDINTAILECCSHQQRSNVNAPLFLLSELEKVWVSVAILARRALLSGNNIQLPHLGSFWMQNTAFLTDPIHHTTYHTRELCFGINRSFALRYGLDSVRVPQEDGRRGCELIKVADIVNVCGVPATVVSASLKELMLYIGEGIYAGRVFSLALPGLATVMIKKERLTLLADAELLEEFFAIDSRKWPPEVKRQAQVMMQAHEQQRPNSRMPTSARSSLAEQVQIAQRRRPASSSSRPGSRCSWRSSSSTARTSEQQTQARRPDFVPIAPAGRLFEDIAKERQRREEAVAAARAAELAHAREQARLDRRLHLHMDCARGMEEVCETPRRPDTASGESIYDVLPPQSYTVVPEPAEIVIECNIDDDDQDEVVEAPHPQRAGMECTSQRAPLDRILVKEEAFSRPGTRQRHAHEHCSIKELLYASPVLSAPSTAPKFGRKRFDEEGGKVASADHVGKLLTEVHIN